MTNDDHERISGLDQLEVPDPNDTFWDELHDRLIAVYEDELNPSPATGGTPHRDNRRRPPHFAVAAALIVIAGLVGLTLWRTARSPTPGAPAPGNNVNVSDPMSIDLDAWVTPPATGAGGTFTVFDVSHLPPGWRVRDAPVGAHPIDDANPAHYGWNTALTTDDDRLVYLSARITNDPSPGTIGTPVTVHDTTGLADGDTLHWQNPAGVRFSVISPGATPDQLVQIADAVPLAAVTELHAPDVPATDTPPSGEPRLAGTVNGVQWQIVSAADASTSLTLSVSGSVWSSTGGAARTSDRTYERVVTGLGEHGIFMYGIAPAAIARIRLQLDGQSITLPTAHDDNGTAIYAIPIPAGLKIRQIEFLTETGHVAHRADASIALTPTLGSSAHQDEPFDPPNDTSPAASS